MESEQRERERDDIMGTKNLGVETKENKDDICSQYQSERDEDREKQGLGR